MRITTCAVALFVLVVIPVRVHAEGTLAAARELYASAAYNDALEMLNGLMPAAKAPDELQSIDLYRTLCLVALGRNSDADRAIEAMIMRDPLYRASIDDLSPRLRSAFGDVRKRLLPAIIQKQYADSKAAFEKKEFELASVGFEGVLKGIADPDIAALASVPPLSDLRTLALGFKDLSAKSIAPPAPPPAPVAPVARPPVRTMYSADDAGVVGPVAIQQKVPRYPAAVLKPIAGMIELVIDEAGVVQSEMMRVAIDPMFDKLVLAAAAKWKYQPATMNGVPVKFMKRLSITVSPTSP
jgi:hypothetical protein